MSRLVVGLRADEEDLIAVPARCASRDPRDTALELDLRPIDHDVVVR
jgi:hypothetical protein